MKKKGMKEGRNERKKGMNGGRMEYERKQRMEGRKDGIRQKQEATRKVRKKAYRNFGRQETMTKKEMNEERSERGKEEREKVIKEY